LNTLNCAGGQKGTWFGERWLRLTPWGTVLASDDAGDALQTAFDWDALIGGDFEMKFGSTVLALT
jgi:hypothetical protein